MKFRTTIDGRSFEIEVDHDQLVRIDGQPLYVGMEQVGGLPLYSLRLDPLDDETYLLFVDRDQEQYRVEVRGRLYDVQVEAGRPRLVPPAVECGPGNESNGCRSVAAPLAGRLLSVPVARGDSVQAGQVVAVVESMKMQMELRAPRDGTVAEIHATPGSDLARGTEIITITPSPF